MPHISKVKLNPKIEKLFLDSVYSTFSNKVRKQLVCVFDSLITPTEAKMIAKRLAIFYFSEKGHTTEEICKLTKTTPQTVTRVRFDLRDIDKETQKALIKHIHKSINKLMLKSAIKSILDIQPPTKHVKRTLHVG